MTVEQLLSSIGSEELTEWQAFERLEPFGQIPLRRQLGSFMSMFHNAMPTKVKRRTTSPEHFTIGDSSYLTGERPKQTVTQMKAMLEAMAGKK